MCTVINAQLPLHLSCQKPAKLKRVSDHVSVNVLSKIDVGLIEFRLKLGRKVALVVFLRF